MKNTIVKAVVTAMLLGILLNLLTGCFLRSGIKDGPGMVNYNGILLEALRGEWYEGDDGSYSIVFIDDYTVNLRYDYEPLLENARLTLYGSSTNTDEYSEFDISPNTFTDEAGDSFEITKASHENGAVTLELTAQDGTKSTLTFYRLPEDTDGTEVLDGPGMFYYGGYLDEAITGCWHSEDGRYTLDMDGRCADFFADGVQLVSKDYGNFVEHGFSEGDDVNERCDLFPSGNFLDDFDEPPITISEMWYKADHIYMLISLPDGNTDEVVFNRQDESMPEGELTQASEAAQGESAPEEAPVKAEAPQSSDTAQGEAEPQAEPPQSSDTAQGEAEPQAEPPQSSDTAQGEAASQAEVTQAITMESIQGDEYMTVTFSALPATFEEFTALAEGRLQSPQNTCALFMLALNMYTADKDAGLKAIDVLRGPRPMNGFDTQFIRDRLRDKAYLPLAYFDGAMPENNYAPAEPYTLRLYADARPEDCEAGYMRLFLKTAGADSARPIKLRQKGDEWFLWEYSSVLSGIRIPAAADPWA